MTTTNTVKQISTMEDYDAALKKYRVVIVDFYTTWCGPCKVISPMFEQLAAANASKTDVLFCKVDSEKAEAISEKCEISSVPTFLFYQNAKNVDSIEGADQAALIQKVGLWTK